MARRREHHSAQTQAHAADGALQRNGTHPPADVHEFIHFLQRVLHRDNVSRFCRHVAVLSHRHADRGRHHGRGVVDAVADIESFRARGFLAHDRQFFFRALLRVNFFDADLLGQIADFRFAIPGNDHDALEVMFRSQVLNKRMPFGSRRIAQAERRRETAIEHDHAFEPTGERRKVLGAGNLLRNEFAAAGNLNLMTADRSSQSLTGRLAHLRRLLKVKAFLFRPARMARARGCFE